MSEQTDIERRHAAVWGAIEAIAERKGISVSRLAVLAGHDATAMNKSKRVQRGTLRWPSTHLIACITDVAGISFARFGRLVDQQMRQQA